MPTPEGIPSTSEMLRWSDTRTVSEVAQRRLCRGLRGVILGSSRETPRLHLTQRISMTSQQLLQSARDVMVCGTDARRKSLQTYAIAQGRTQDQVRKASTMRLALWSRGYKSAI